MYCSVVCCIYHPLRMLKVVVNVVSVKGNNNPSSLPPPYASLPTPPLPFWRGTFLTTFICSLIQIKKNIEGKGRKMNKIKMKKGKAKNRSRKTMQ